MAAAKKTLVLTTLANLSLPASALATAPLLARALGAEGRGLYAAIASPIAVIAVVGTLGLQDSLMAMLGSRRLSLDAAYRSIRRWLPLLAATAALLVAFFSLVVLRTLPLLCEAVVFLSIAAPVSVATSVAYGIAAGTESLRTVNTNRVALAASRLVLLPLLFILGWLSLENALAVFIVSQIGALALMLRSLARSERPTTSTANEEAKVPSRLAMHMLIASTLTVGLAKLDQSVAVSFTSAEQLGFYAVSVSIAEAANALVVAVRTQLLGSSDPALMTRSTQWKWLGGLLAMGAAIGAIALLLAPILIPLIFGSSFTPAVEPTQVLLLGIPFLLVLTAAATFLARNRKEHLQSASFFVAVVANMALLVVLTPPYGANGLAAASLIALAIGAGFSCLCLLRTGFERRSR